MNKAFQIFVYIVMLETLLVVSGIGHFQGSGFISSAIANGPESFSQSGFLGLFKDAFSQISAAGATAASLIIIGALVFKQDLVFAGAIAIAMTSVVPDLLVLYGILSAIHPLIAFVIVMPIMMILVWALLEWMRTPLA